LLALVQTGMKREQAYAVVQKNALESWDTKKPLKDLLLLDRQVVEQLSPEGIERCFDPTAVLSRTNEIFKRALGEPQAQE
jgi:adenylosuccinate lyase